MYMMMQMKLNFRYLNLIQIKKQSLILSNMH